WQKPESELTPEQRQLMPSILKGLIPDLTALAKTSDDSVRLESVNIAGQVRDLNARIQKTIGYRTQINYPYWKTLAQAEQEERTVTARRLVYEAEQANKNAELDKAIELYEQAFAVWAEIFDDYPLLTIDDTAEDLFNSVRRYMVAIDSQEIPEDFPLATFVSLMGEFGQVDARMYETIRQESKITAEKRRIELEEEEKKRQDEADKIDAAVDGTTSESTATESTATEKSQPKNSEQPSSPGEDATQEPGQSE
ncbi:MAG: IRE (iron responsive element), partial [Rubripirellula sp.]|nr:IRE (iron responsive element) [Rubripirellula sp.]